MKIGCLQFASELGKIEKNIARADEVLKASGIKPGDLDLLALPELAFTGYNFPDLKSITPYLEPTSAGPSTAWATRTAQRLHCTVTVGYPEAAALPPSQVSAPSQPNPHVNDSFQTLGRPVIPNRDPAFPHNYNASVTVSPEGKVLAHYRKAHLYYTDASWSCEGSGFYAGYPIADDKGESKKTAMGICMDLNNYNFTAPWTAFEFGNHVVESEAQVVVVNMAWLGSDLTREDVEGDKGKEPEVSTVGYWVQRLRPVVQRAKGEKVICVMANRCGVEAGYEGGEEKEVCYAGTSAVMGLGEGEAVIWDMLGKGEERVLVVDTDEKPKYEMKGLPS